MSFKLAIGNVVEVPVRFTLADNGRPRAFSFTITATLMALPELRALLDADNAQTKDEFMRDKVLGWKGQTLVLDEDNAPAPFSLDALDAMFSVIGVGGVVFDAYLEACGAKGKKGN